MSNTHSTVPGRRASFFSKYMAAYNPANPPPKMMILFFFMVSLSTIGLAFPSSGDDLGRDSFTF